MNRTLRRIAAATKKWSMNEKWFGARMTGPVGGTLGVAVLASVFAANGSYASPQAFTDGLTSAAWVGAAVLGAGALIALLVPGKPREGEAEAQVAEPGVVALS
jgi:hypothetical protein